MQMQMLRRLVITSLLTSAAACMSEPLYTERDAEPKKVAEADDEASSEDDEDSAPAARSDARVPPARPAPGNDAGTTPSEDGEPPAVDGPADPGELPPEGTPSEEMPPAEGEPAQSQIAGTAVAAKCSTYGKRTGDMCAGVFCGVTLEQLEAELNPEATCAVTAEQICAGKMPTTTALCTRMIKSDPFNALDDDKTLRTKVRECIYETEPGIKENASPACTDCFLDAAICSSTHCVAQCLTGDSAECDKCRDANDCTKPVFACAGVPNPF